MREKKCVRTQIFVVPVCRFAMRAVNIITNYRPLEPVPYGQGGTLYAKKLNRTEFEKLKREGRNPKRRLEFEVYYRDGNSGPVWKKRQLQRIRKNAKTSKYSMAV